MRGLVWERERNPKVLIFVLSSTLNAFSNRTSSHFQSLFTPLHILAPHHSVLIIV